MSEIVPARPWAGKYSGTYLGFAKNIVFLSKNTSTELGCLGTSLAPVGVERFTDNTAGGGVRIGIGVFCKIWSLVDIL